MGASVSSCPRGKRVERAMAINKRAVDDRMNSDKGTRVKQEACAWGIVAVQALDWMAALRSKYGALKRET